ncbi:MAG: hypothetical protein HYV09_32280 [Deltaproteobacteria bacterium]|nr:hypothetical protein [Deltaproteobacteria bacterium]
MSDERRDPYEALGVSRAAPREVIAKEYRRKAVRERRLIEHDADAVRRLHDLNQAYAAISRPRALDRNGYMLVVILVGVLLVGYLLDVRRRAFVYAPVIIGVAGLFWLLDSMHRRLTAPKAPSLSADGVVSQTEQLLGGILEEPVVAAQVEPPASGPYLVETLYVGDDDETVGVIPAGSALPFAQTFVLSTTREHDRVMTIPVSAGHQPLAGAHVHALRPIREGDLFELRVVVEADGRVSLDVRDSYTDAALRVDTASPLHAPVAVAGYRA